MQSAPSIKYQAVGKVVLRRIGEDILLVPVSGSAARNNCVFPINRTGELIWQRISAGFSVEDAARSLTEVFSTSYEIALDDCRSFVQTLVDQHLLEVLPS